MLFKARNRAVRGELMNKADLIEVLADQTGSTKVDAAKALDAIVDAVSGELAKGGSV